MPPALYLLPAGLGVLFGLGYLAVIRRDLGLEVGLFPRLVAAVVSVIAALILAGLLLRPGL